MDNAIELSLETWYPEDHPLHLDPLHPAIALAGETGELLNLYKKEKFKPGVSWWDCKYCGTDKENHINSKECHTDYKYYTPEVLDELGDLWYYLRILAYQQKMDLLGLTPQKKRDNVLKTLISMDKFCIELLEIYIEAEKINLSILTAIFFYLQDFLFSLNYTLDQLTELNYNKLKDGDNNGWEAAREVPNETMYCVTWEHPEWSGGKFFIPANNENEAKIKVLQSLGEDNIRPTRIISVEAV